MRWSQQSGKPDVDRDLGYQARDERTIRMRLATMQKNLDVPTDRAVLTYFFRRAAALPAGQRLESLDAALAATGKTGDGAIAALLDETLGKTSLTDEKTRMALLRLDEAGVAATHDPMLAFAFALRKDMKAIEDHEKISEGVLIELTPRYIDALAAFRQAPLYPDANSTIRFTFATVKGYSPRDGVYYEPFTTLSGVIAKCTGVEPFNCPTRLVDAAARREFGPYVAAPLGDVPACFLSTNDITGGNSGSPIMNGKGELVGLAFDGDYESMTSGLHAQRCALADDQRGHPLRALVHGLRGQGPLDHARDGDRAQQQVRCGPMRTGNTPGSTGTRPRTAVSLEVCGSIWYKLRSARARRER